MLEKFKKLIKYAELPESCKIKVSVDGKKVQTWLFLDFIPEEEKWIVVLETYINDRWIQVKKRFSEYEEAKRVYEELRKGD